MRIGRINTPQRSAKPLTRKDKDMGNETVPEAGKPAASNSTEKDVAGPEATAPVIKDSGPNK